jgi:hypothetical protein
MLRGAIVVVLALLLGVAGFALMRWRQAANNHYHPAVSAQHGPDGQHQELEWLRAELKATDAQMAKIIPLHIAYHPVCEALTRRVEASHLQLDSITAQATSLTPELQSAIKDHAAVHLDCQEAMLKHFYDTAACLEPAQARRYLDEMLPLVFHDPNQDQPTHSH